MKYVGSRSETVSTAEGILDFGSDVLERIDYDCSASRVSRRHIYTLEYHAIPLQIVLGTPEGRVKRSLRPPCFGDCTISRSKVDILGNYFSTNKRLIRMSIDS